MRWCLVYVFLIFQFIAIAQLTVNDKLLPNELVLKHLLSENSGVEVKNINYKGFERSIGSFNHPSEYAFFQKGIVLSTGLAIQVQGPNHMPNKGIPLMRPGDKELSRIAKVETYDACVLEFDFKVEGDSIVFEFFFGSEEYPEYVNKGVNDVFGFFLSGEGVEGIINLAQLPNGKGPITVDNVNRFRNQEFYFENLPWDNDNILQWENNRKAGEFAYAHQLDGFIKPMPIGIKLNSNQWYHLKIAIADVGDAEYDSAVFLKSNSLKSKETKEFIAAKSKQDFESKLEKRFGDTEFKKLDEHSWLLITHINFEFDKSEILTTEREILDFIADIMLLENKLSLTVIGHTDGKGSLEYNQNLSTNRALSVKNYLISKGISNDKLNSKGMGKTTPINTENSANANAENRRVEFVFKKE